mgnify:CR=1 FL=1
MIIFLDNFLIEVFQKWVCDIEKIKIKRSEKEQESKNNTKVQGFENYTKWTWNKTNRDLTEKKKVLQFSKTNTK